MCCAENEDFTHSTIVRILTCMKYSLHFQQVYSYVNRGHQPMVGADGIEPHAMREGDQMQTRIHERLHTASGRIAVIACLVIAVSATAWSMMRYFGPDAAQRYSNNPLFIDSVTGQTFHYQLKAGDMIPVISPFTHRHTGYPAAFSYWSKNGQILRHPEAVLLNSWLGKNAPTFAPLSGRLVTPNEKPPMPGSTPPPTKAQYEQWLSRARAMSSGGS
jgi:hypothetical protein